MAMEGEISIWFHHHRESILGSTHTHTYTDDAISLIHLSLRASSPLCSFCRFRSNVESIAIYRGRIEKHEWNAAAAAAALLGADQSKPLESGEESGLSLSTTATALHRTCIALFQSHAWWFVVSPRSKCKPPISPVVINEFWIEKWLDFDNSIVSKSIIKAPVLINPFVFAAAQCLCVGLSFERSFRNRFRWSRRRHRVKPLRTGICSNTILYFPQSTHHWPCGHCYGRWRHWHHQIQSPVLRIEKECISGCIPEV